MISVVIADFGISVALPRGFAVWVADNFWLLGFLNLSHRIEDGRIFW